ncbi:MAG: TfoX/Sxy family protein [Chloroflexota bacterium]
MPSSMPPMPKTDAATEAAFRALVPDDPRVTLRPMFGNLSAFVNGQMFSGVFGSDLFVRLDDVGRDELRQAGGGPFEPMPGRPMREYAMVPGDWRADPTPARAWVERALAWAAALPPKSSATTKTSPKAKTTSPKAKTQP